MNYMVVFKRGVLQTLRGQVCDRYTSYSTGLLSDMCVVVMQGFAAPRVCQKIAKCDK